MAYGEIGSGSLKITDNYNNSFTVTATPGTSGAGNPVTKSSLWISQTKDSSGKWVWGSAIAGGTGSFSRTINLTDITTADTKTVGAYLRTYATYGENKNLEETANIRQYVAPSSPKIPELMEVNYTGKRLTADMAWTWSWEPATATNKYSPIVGYRIRLYKNGSLIKGLSINKSTNGQYYLVKGSNTNEYLDYEGYDDDLNTKKSLIIEKPTTFGFKAGDTVKLGLFAYTRKGINNDGYQLFSGGSTQQVNSGIYTVENKGVMRVKINNSWKEGQVYVKTGESWKEAQGVYTKVNGSWKEST